MSRIILTGLSAWKKHGYKVHSKICLITYRSRGEIQYITQIGTGNYNEKTAAMYTDLSLMTANPAIGKDAAEFFKNMSIGNLAGQYDYLIVSPTSLKQKILYLMDEEIKKGSNGRIIMKMNSVTDVDFSESGSDRAGNLLYFAGCNWLYGQCPCDECCRKISGASAYFQFWKWK